jgi:hypothetical protein
MTTEIVSDTTFVGDVDTKQTPTNSPIVQFDSLSYGRTIALSAPVEPPAGTDLARDWAKAVSQAIVEDIGAFWTIKIGAPTQGTVAFEFFEQPLTDTADDLFTARVRRRLYADSPTRLQSRAWVAFTELAGWLGIGKVATAALLGVSRGTTIAWKRGGAPQPANERRLNRTHTVVKTLIRRMGLPEARNWLESGTPSPLELLGDGDFEAFDKVASAVVFDPTARARERIDAFVGDDDRREPEGLVVSDASSARRRVKRSPPRRRTK